MEIRVFGNRLLVRSVCMGSTFTDVVGDITIDRRGRVRLTNDRMSFYIDLESVGVHVLRAVIGYLDEHAEVKGFERVNKRMKEALRSKGS